jgi:hypothetical protein
MREQLLKLVASFCDTPLGLTRTFTLGRAKGRQITSMESREEGVRCSLIRSAAYARLS